VTLRVIRWSECRTMPWRNGGGETVEIAIAPEGASFADFDWRISSALVASDGPFSALPEIERTLCVTSEGALALEIDGGRLRLDRASAPCRFSGDAAVTAKLPGLAIRDLNVMTRRGRADHSVEVIEIAAPLSLEPAGDLVALFLAAGRAVVAGQHGPLLLDAGDTVLAHSAGLRIALPGDDAPESARAILVRLWPTNPALLHGAESASA
jgi:environmental stress-induced protein Ves